MKTQTANTLLSIADAAKRLGVSTKTLRRWEVAGKVIPQRTFGNQRRYTLAQIEELKHPHALQMTIPVPAPVFHEDYNFYNVYKSFRKPVLVVLGALIITFGLFKEFSQKPALQKNRNGGQETVLGEQALSNFTSPAGGPTVLAAASPSGALSDFIFSVNVPAIYGQSATFNNGIDVTGGITADTGVFNTLTASNILYGVKAGSGISVSSGQTPTIANTGVLSLGGKTGSVELTAGDGITVDGTTITNKDMGSAQNIFKTINDITASSNTDILTFAQGGGVTITTDPTTKTITISSVAPDYTLSGWTKTGTVVGLAVPTDTVDIGSSSLTAGAGNFASLNVSGATNLNGAITFGDQTTDTITFTGRLKDGTSILPTTDLGSDLGSASLRFNNLWVANINSNSSQAFSGQTTFSYAPTDTTINQASVLINPATSVVNGQLLGFALAGYERAAIDAEGDLTLGFSNGVTSIHENNNPLSIYGHNSTNVAFINTAGQLNIFQVNAIDATGLKLYDDGGNGIFVKDGGNVGIGTVNPTENLTVVGNMADQVASGTAGIKLTDTSDVTKLGISYGTGTVTFDMPGAGANVLQITDSTSGLGQLNVQSTSTLNSGAAALQALIVKGFSGQTANLQEWQDSNGIVLADVTASGSAYFAGNVGIGTSTPAYTLDVNGTGRYNQSLAIGSSTSSRTTVYSTTPTAPTPTLGTDLLSGWNFTSGWTVVGSATVLSANTFSTSATAGVDRSYLSTGAWYSLHFIRSTASGSLELWNFNGGSNPILTGTNTDGTFRAANGYVYVRNTVATTLATVTTMTAQPLTLSSLFSTTSYSGSTDITVQANPTITAGTQGGIVMNLDSASAPANFVIAYTDGTNIYLDKAVAGVYTNLISTAITYVAGQTIKVIKTGNQYALYYNGSQVGTTQTITDATIANGTLDGLFSTYASNTFTGFQISAMPSLTFTNSANASIFSPTSNILSFTTAGLEAMRIDANQNVMIGTTSATAILNTVASGAKTTSYSGNLLTDIATSSTASITKAGLEVQSTGTWNGTSASNIGLYVSSVTGGTNNYDAIFNGGGSVGIGTTAPAYLLDVNGAGKYNQSLAIGSSTSTRTTMVSDTFTRANGAISNVESPANTPWTGATWTVATNAATNTPTLGSELATGNLVIGNWYSITATTTNYFYTGCAVGNTFRATATTALDVTDKVKLLTLATLPVSISYTGSTERTTQANVTVTAGTQAGVIISLDSAVTPAYFIIAYTDGTNIYMDKNVNGTYTNLITTAISYVAGQTIQIVRTNTNYALFYNGVQKGTTQTITDAGIINNTLHGLFSTYASNILDNFTLSAMPMLTFTNANNASIYSSTTNTLNFTTAGLEAMRIDANQNVAIGTTSATAKLSIGGSASVSGSLTFNGATAKINAENGNNLSFATSVGGDAGLTTQMTITNAGLVGIGTAAPTSKLQVEGNIASDVAAGANGLKITNAGVTQLGISYGTNASYIDTQSAAGNKFTNYNLDSNLTGWNYANTLLDTYTDAHTAGNVNNTTADTGQTRSVTDTNSKISIGSGVLSFATGGTTADGIWYPIQTRTAGKVLLGSVTPAAASTSLHFGWGTSATSPPSDRIAFSYGGSNTFSIGVNGAAPIVTGTFTAGTTYNIAAVLRTTGVFWFIKGGTEYPNWTSVFPKSAFFYKLIL